MYLSFSPLLDIQAKHMIKLTSIKCIYVFIFSYVFFSLFLSFDVRVSGSATTAALAVSA